ncbi:MAG TPA: ABC transporter permease [Sphingomicrobium sp.]|jgi:ABC-2 type transport system permease protein
MIAAFTTEIIKLRRSLALLLCVAAPSMVAILATVMLMDRDKPSDWQTFAIGSTGLWSFFMLPMTVTALTVLIAQMEHGPRFWNHLLALPVPRWRIFMAKALVVVLLVAAMMAGLAILMPLAGRLGEALASGQQLTGTLDMWQFVELLATMFKGSLLLIAVQLWAALRFRSFVPPLVIGIGGTFVAVVATGAKQGVWFPWLIPTNALASDPARGEFAIQLGLWGGIAALALMVLDLNRKSFA